jgi:hypothetical protein
MSRWSDENVKKVGLERFTRNKFEYAIGKSIDMEVEDAIDMFVEIARNYARYKIVRVIKESKQTGMFETERP